MAGFLNQYQILFNKAKADLEAANVLYKKLMEGDSNLDQEIICFHLQQCAEKLLKAVLSKNEIYFPKIHDLETLLYLLDDNRLDLNTNRDILIELNDFAVEGRYAVMQEELENIKEIFVTVTDLFMEVQKIINT
ncbi:MAG: HEPN domain-containing protein [Prolixibacteraceae bacterium]|nr:HEPN domain-containing protein [Prolixibacteraceae bacterium]